MTIPADWVWRGRAWVLPDGVPLDGGVIPFELVRERATNPALLASRLFEDVRTDLAGLIAPGDVILAGRDFARGKPHPQGLIALAARGVLVLCVSAPYLAWRGAVARALPMLRDVAACTEWAADGDAVEADAAHGAFRNLTRDEKRRFPPIAPDVQRMIAAGGLHGAIREAMQRS
jgi:3-isopropylmalate/(R)-2-methylmalate dehydratase small subunit